MDDDNGNRSVEEGGSMKVKEMEREESFCWGQGGGEVEVEQLHPPPNA